MFAGIDFVYNEIPSDKFGFLIGEIGGKGSREDMTALSYTIIEEKIHRNPKPYYYGVEEDNKLQFEMTIFREIPLDRYDEGAIAKWLFNKQYNDLTIIQDDLNGIYYRCMFLNPRKVQFANKPYAIKFDVVCDSPYAWTEEITKEFTVNSTATTLSLYSPSTVNDYLYPKLEIITSSSTTSFSLYNMTDSDTREFKFSGLQTSQTITVDNNLGIITSNKNASSQNFSKKWFRLLPEDNVLKATGACTLKVIAKYPITT